MKAAVLVLAAVAAILFSTTKSQASSIVSAGPGSDLGIKLTVSGFVKITTRLGELACTHGTLTLESPKLKVPSSSETLTNVIEKYGENGKTSKGDSTTKLIGPYVSGTVLVLAINPTSSICKNEHLLSSDPLHARISKHNDNSWTIIWEDLKDRDFNDLYTDIEVIPKQNLISDDLKGKQAFSDNPKYAFPWKLNDSHKVSQIPGVGNHYNSDAYDFSGKFDVYSPEKGLVLWVEDSFAVGGDDPSYEAKVNVLVLQTSADTQVTLVHLAKNSVHSLGINIGDVVEKGQLVGKTDLTGYTTGVHLHMEFQTVCHTFEENFKTWQLIVSGKRSHTHLDWSCPTKSFFSDGFWSGGIFYSKLALLRSYTNLP